MARRPEQESRGRAAGFTRAERQMKIFMGMCNIASLMHDYASGFRALGHEVFCVSEEDIAIRKADLDLNIPRLIAARLSRLKHPTQEDQLRLRKHFRELAWQKALEADLCFFIWNTFEQDASDLPMLRKMGKKIVVRFCGSDVRDMEVDRQAALHCGTPYTDYGLDSAGFLPRLHYLRMCERHAHLLINGSYMSLRPVFGRGSLLFQPESSLCETRQREHPVILHAPSNKATKGTGIWLQIFDALRSAGLQFGVKLVEGLPHEEMPREFASADIFCNSLFYGGRAAWEALSAGCVVVEGESSKNHVEYCRSQAGENLRGLGVPDTPESQAWWWRAIGFERMFSHTPVVHVSPENAAQKLAELILDHPRREKLAEQGPAYVTELSPQAACRSILEQLENPESLEKRSRLLWLPFFNLHYMTERDSPERIALFNTYTAMVRGCRWYKDYVIPCERGGLRF